MSGWRLVASLPAAAAATPVGGRIDMHQWHYQFTTNPTPHMQLLDSLTMCLGCKGEWCGSRAMS